MNPQCVQIIADFLNKHTQTWDIATFQEYSIFCLPQATPTQKKKRNNKPTKPTSTFHPTNPTKSGKIHGHIKRKSESESRPKSPRSPFSCSPGRWSPNSDEAFAPPFGPTTTKPGMFPQDWCLPALSHPLSSQGGRCMASQFFLRKVMMFFLLNALQKILVSASTS